MRLQNSQQGKLGKEKLTDRGPRQHHDGVYCGYELKTGSAGGWTGAWETAATEISGKGLEAPGRSTSYERCGFCVQSAGRAGLTGEGRYLQQKLHNSLQALERQREAGGGWVQQERVSRAETRLDRQTGN